MHLPPQDPAGVGYGRLPPGYGPGPPAGAGYGHQAAPPPHYGPPPGYAAPPGYGPPPGYGAPREPPPAHHAPVPPHYQAMHRAPPVHGAPPHHGPQPGQFSQPPVAVDAGPRHPAEFAQTDPLKYQAFEEMSVSVTEEGVHVRLVDGACLDRHVADFVSCLECWFHRRSPEPRSPSRPWRLCSLELARNSLSDDSLKFVLDHLKRLDVRVAKLLLASNCMQDAGLTALTEYMWNNCEPLLELDISENEVAKGSKEAAARGAEGVSALLRCLYNHPGYPYAVRGHHGGTDVRPLILLGGGNYLHHPNRLLKEIHAKGGAEHVRLCQSPAPYQLVGKEFLSVYMPGFDTQRYDHEARRRRKEKGAQEAVAHHGAAQNGAPLQGVPAAIPALPAPQAPPREEPPAAAPQPAPEEADDAGDPGADDGPDFGGSAPSSPGARSRSPGPDPFRRDRSRSGSSGGSAGRARGAGRGAAPLPQEGLVLGRSPAPATGASEDARAPPAPPAPPSAPRAQAAAARALDKAEQKELQRVLCERVSTIEGMSTDQGTRDMLAEYIVCMVVERKTPAEVETELRDFLGHHAPPFLEWLLQYLDDTYAIKLA